MKDHQLRYPFLLILFVSIVVFNSCKQTDQPSPAELGYDYNYSPLKVGSYIIYDVHEVTYQAGVDSVVKRYQEKYLFMDTINGSNTIDNKNGWIYARYKRDNNIQPWQNDSIWNIRYSTGKQALVVTENNVPLVKLFYPLKNNLTWNGNSENKFGQIPASSDDMYKLVNFQKPFTSGPATFPNTLTVNQHMFAECNKKDVRKEVYAYNIGMVYRITQAYQYVQYPVSDPNYCNHYIGTGWFKELKYNNHGQE